MKRSSWLVMGLNPGQMSVPTLHTRLGRAGVCHTLPSCCWSCLVSTDGQSQLDCSRSHRTGLTVQQRYWQSICFFMQGLKSLEVWITTYLCLKNCSTWHRIWISNPLSCLHKDKIDSRCKSKSLDIVFVIKKKCNSDGILKACETELHNIAVLCNARLRLAAAGLKNATTLWPTIVQCSDKAIGIQEDNMIWTKGLVCITYLHSSCWLTISSES